MRFANPLWLWALGLVVLYFIWARRQGFSTVLYSDLTPWQTLKKSLRSRWVRLPLYLRTLTLISIVIALAQPQSVHVDREVTSSGIDIMVALDVSGSMAAEDFKPNNRLEVAKLTLQEFIKKRKTDSIGMVVFGSDAYTQCPLTVDYHILIDLLGSVELNMAGDGTAIGMAIATGLNRLKNSPRKNKVMIVLTDGENNAGQITPLAAASLARDLGVKIYTVGVGSNGQVQIPINHPQYGKIYTQAVSRLDEELLKNIALKTRGYYFRALDAEGLKNVLSEINSLEKTDIKTKTYYQYTDFFPFFVALACGLYLIELLISLIWLVRIP